MFSNYNNVILSLKEVLNFDILTLFEKQFCIETLLIYYESNYMKTLIQDGLFDVKNLVMRGLIINSYSQFKKRMVVMLDSPKFKIKSIMDKLIQGKEISRKDKAIFILNLIQIDSAIDNIINYVFRSIVMSGNFEYMRLIDGIVDRVLFPLKMCESNMDLKYICGDKSRKGGRKCDALELIRVFLKYKDIIVLLSEDEKIELGQALLDLLLDCFKDLFEKYSDVNTVGKKIHRVSYVKVNREYSAK